MCTSMCKNDLWACVVSACVAQSLNAFLLSLSDWARECPAEKIVHMYNSFFYGKLTERGSYDYDRVRRWTKKVTVKSRALLHPTVHIPPRRRDLP